MSLSLMRALEKLCWKPHHLLSFLLIDSWGRKLIQTMGFVTMGPSLHSLHDLPTIPPTGFAYDKLNASLPVYCLTNFFQNSCPT
ncbi:hypothetical protein EDC04DRAFT_2701562 [Pisolithus marmoratus]|nr:hypothetical protein EDC04DRAFT_2701562 [Pisolithus marmoratus]